MVNLEHANWVFKKVEESKDKTSNINLEIIFNFYDGNKVEININQFTFCLNIDFDTYFDKEKYEIDYNDQINNNTNSNIKKMGPSMYAFKDYHGKNSNIGNVEEVDNTFTSSMYV